MLKRKFIVSGCLFLFLLTAGFPQGSSISHKTTSVEAAPAKIAFPGATGGGMFTSGGRGGQVIKVTNLNDAGMGSLRQAINTSGARTILFDVSGTITLESPIIIRHGDLTIAGQSAPGDGICLKGHEVRIAANNIIIRYIRFRPGDIAGREYDALTGIGQKNIIIDHCSMSWSTDETVSFYDNEDFTLQWCIISESLNKSAHSKGAHGYGGIWGGRNASFAFNLLAHHNSRNPRLQGARSFDESAMEKAEILYNIMYNWGDKAMYGGENGRYNILYNQFIPGPATSRSESREIFEPYKPYGQFFVEGNILEGNADVSADNWLGVYMDTDSLSTARLTDPLPFAGVWPEYAPGQVLDAVLKYAGASLARDAADRRIIRDVQERTASCGQAGIIDSQDEAGGWPTLSGHSPLPDSDGDGMPDDWETRHKLDPNNPDDGQQYALHPKYTNLEMYLNDIVQNTSPGIMH